MRILAINSSLRGKRGMSAFLLKRIFEGAEMEGAECEALNLSELKINRCKACGACQRKKRECIHGNNDDVSMIFESMRKADIIIFATPVYTFGMSSLLKMLLERYYGTARTDEFNITKRGLFFHHIDEEMCRKPFATLVVCDNVENRIVKNVLSYFDTYAKFMEAGWIGSLVRRSAGSFGLKNGSVDESDDITAICEAYVRAGRELAVSGKISGITEKKANKPLIRIPHFVKIMLKMGIGRKKVFAARSRMFGSKERDRRELSELTFRGF